MSDRPGVAGLVRPIAVAGQARASAVAGLVRPIAVAGQQGAADPQAVRGPQAGPAASREGALPAAEAGWSEAAAGGRVIGPGVVPRRTTRGASEKGGRVGHGPAKGPPSGLPGGQGRAGARGIPRQSRGLREAVRVLRGRRPIAPGGTVAAAHGPAPTERRLAAL